MQEYFVVGEKLPHTLSPEIHRKFGCDYGVKELDCDGLERFVSERGFKGVNVTVPYKERIIPFLDDVDIEAARIGAVNTVVNADGELLGFNTDVGGMEFALQAAGISIENKRVLILGSGGTSKTATRVAERGGAADIKIVSRTGKLNYSNCYADAADTEVIINTTPVGTFPDINAAPLDPSNFANLEGVFDVVYNPLKTKLIYGAEKLGAVTANGLPMLVEQARLAHNLFESYARCGGIYDGEITPVIAEKIKKDRLNISLIGMPGSGKSVIGQKLAEVCGKKFIDTDKEIERIAEKSVERIFAEDGERVFREIENSVIKEFCGLKSGFVISTGGGALINGDNRFFVKCNSAAVLILRGIDKLESKGRPLMSKPEDTARIFEERKDIYFNAADITVENDKTVENAVAEIRKKLGI